MKERERVERIEETHPTGSNWSQRGSNYQRDQARRCQGHAISDDPSELMLRVLQPWAARQGNAQGCTTSAAQGLCDLGGPPLGI